MLWHPYWTFTNNPVAPPPPDVTAPHGGKGDNPVRRSRNAKPQAIFKPTGLLDRKRLNPKADPVVEARIEQSIEIAREIAAENAVKQQAEITAAQQERILRTLDIQLQDARAINREIAAIIAEARRRSIEDEELIILLLIAGSV